MVPLKLKVIEMKKCRLDVSGVSTIILPNTVGGYYRKLLLEISNVYIYEDSWH